MVDSPRCISWLENLINGFTGSLFHPFTPLAATDFNFECLFSHQPYCCAKTGCNKHPEEHPIGHLIEHSNKILDKSISNGYVNLLQDLPNRMKDIITFVRPPDSSRLEPPSLHTNEALLSRLNNSFVNIVNYMQSKPSNALLAIQLTICSIILSCVIYKDVKLIANFMKTSQNRQKLIKSILEPSLLRTGITQYKPVL